MGTEKSETIKKITELQRELAKVMVKRALLASK